MTSNSRFFSAAVLGDTCTPPYYGLRIPFITSPWNCGSLLPDALWFYLCGAAQFKPTSSLSADEIALRANSLFGALRYSIRLNRFSIKCLCYPCLRQTLNLNQTIKSLVPLIRISQKARQLKKYLVIKRPLVR